MANMFKDMDWERADREMCVGRGLHVHKVRVFGWGIFLG
jgi:hypothetical protein